MSDPLQLPLLPQLPRPDPAVAGAAADELVKVDFDRIYAVYLDNLQQKASLFKLLISFVIAPYLVAVAFLSAKALSFADLADLRDLPTFLDFVIVVAGAGLLLPLFQYIEYDDNVMRTARALNKFRCLYADHMCVSSVWQPNLPLDCNYPRERQIGASGTVLVLVFMAISVVYVAKGVAGLADADPLDPAVIVTAAVGYAGLGYWYLRSGRNWRYKLDTDRGELTQTIIANSVGRAWARYLEHVLRQGKPLHNDPDPIVEAPPVLITVNDVADDDAVIGRYGDPNVKELYVRKMFSHDVLPELGTTYGDRLFDYDGHDQIATAVEELRRHAWSNKATITLLDPMDRWPDRRMPCLAIVDLKLRDARLFVFAYFRSQNALNAYGNMYGLRAVQSYCAEKLGVAAGPLTLFVSSPHVHECNLERAKAIVKAC